MDIAKASAQSGKLTVFRSLVTSKAEIATNGCFRGVFEVQ
jgi:hypothetical protein